MPNNGSFMHASSNSKSIASSNASTDASTDARTDSYARPYNLATYAPALHPVQPWSGWRRHCWVYTFGGLHTRPGGSV